MNPALGIPNVSVQDISSGQLVLHSEVVVAEWASQSSSLDWGFCPTSLSSFSNSLAYSGAWKELHLSSRASLLVLPLLTRLGESWNGWQCPPPPLICSVLGLGLPPTSSERALLEPSRVHAWWLIPILFIKSTDLHPFSVYWALSCYRLVLQTSTQKCKVMTPAFNKPAAKRQTYTNVMITLTWVWLKFSGVLEEGRVGKAAEIRDGVKRWEPLTLHWRMYKKSAG